MSQKVSIRFLITGKYGQHGMTPLINGYFRLQILSEF